MTVPDRLKLPLVFDAAGLAEEVAALAPDSWTPHFNQAIYEGDWSGVALRSVAGRPPQLYPDPTADDFHFCAAAIDPHVSPYCGFHRRMSTDRKNG